MNVYGLDDTFSWFIAGAGGSHDLKFGAQYQLGEHYREDQRVTNGAFIFPSDRAFNAADPSTYPERLNIRVPQMVQAAVADAFARALRAGQVADDASISRSAWVCATTSTSRRSRSTGIRSSTIRTRIRSTRTTSSLASDSPTARGPASVIRGGYGLFYEKQWIDRFENYMLNPVFTNSFIAQFPVAQADPGPASRTVPDRSAARQRTDVESRPGQPARAAGHAGPEHRHGLAGHAGPDSAVAAPGVDRLRTAARPRSCRSRPTTCTW